MPEFDQAIAPELLASPRKLVLLAVDPADEASQQRYQYKRK